MERPVFDRKTLRRRALKGRRAFLLMEVLLAVVLLGIVLIALNVAIARCVRGLSVAGRVNTALDVLDERIRWSQVDNPRFRTSTQDGVVEVDGVKYEWKQERIPTDEPRLVRIVTLVRWKQSGAEREESRETYRWEDKP